MALFPFIQPEPVIFSLNHHEVFLHKNQDELLYLLFISIIFNSPKILLITHVMNMLVSSFFYNNGFIIKVLLTLKPNLG